MDFGRMPRANAFLLSAEFESEYFFNLQAAFCAVCGLVQLVEQPPPHALFHEKYPFFTGSSKRMKEHFEQWAEEVMRNYLPSPDSFVVEIGSNDGTLLAPFAQKGIRHLGIDPSANVAEKARNCGVQTWCGFFNEDLARRIVAEFGQADAFFAANVFCHIPDLHTVLAGIERLLKPSGLAILEDPYLGDVIQKLSYDQIYDEHVYLFSIASLTTLFKKYGLEVFRIEPQWTHGGSMRYYVGHIGKRPVSKQVEEMRFKEKMAKLHSAETYQLFRKRCEESKDKLISVLREIKQKGQRVAGYAATSKSTTVINYCGINAELIEGIYDTTPAKQGRYSPGAHIPILPYEDFSKTYPDYALLFGWNHAQEIMDKEKEFRQAGGRWLLYVPEVRIF